MLLGKEFGYDLIVDLILRGALRDQATGVSYLCFLSLIFSEKMIFCH